MELGRGLLTPAKDNQEEEKKRREKEGMNLSFRVTNILGHVYGFDH